MIVKHCKNIWLLASIQFFLGSGTLTAQEASVSVAWKIAPTCGGNFQGAVLQQDLEDALRAASIAVSRIHTAGLVADINCQAGSPKGIPVQQCLSLSQAVADPSAANGLHLATTWRNCQSYQCGRQNCGQLARAAQHALVAQFVPAFRALRAENKVPEPSPATEAHVAEGIAMPVVYAAVSKPVLKPSAIFYMVYILLCIAVLARWQWCRKTPFLQ
jgi:hypothetical protein